MAALTGINNPVASVEALRWGIVTGLDASTSGSIDVDDFAWRPVDIPY